MSNNPNEPDLISLGVDFDDDAAMASINAALNKIEQQTLSLDQVLQQMTEDATGARLALENAFGDTSADKISTLAAQVADLDAQLKNATASGGDLKGMFEGLGGLYGGTGGKIGPALPPGFGGDTGGGIEDPTFDDISGGGGSAPGLFGAAHGLRAASGLGKMAGLGEGGTQALTGGADVLYLAQGLRSIGPIFESLNTVIGDTPSVLTPLVSGLANMGVPMAGLAAAALPLAAGLAVVVIGFDAIKSSFSDLSDAFDASIPRLKAYTDAVNSGDTQADVQKKIDKQKAPAAGTSGQDVLDQSFKDLQTKYDDGMARFIFAYGQVFIKGVNDTVDAAGKSSDAAKKAEAATLGLNDAMNNQTVLANTNAEAIRKQVEFDIKQAQEFTGYDKLSTQAIGDKTVALQQDIEAQQRAINTLEQANQLQGLSADQIDKNNAAIDQHQMAMVNDRVAIDHLTDVSIPLAKIREDEANAIAAETAAMQQHMAFLEQEGKLRTSGTQTQLDAEKTRLEDKLAADQFAADTLSAKPGRTKAEDTALAKYQADIKQILSDLASLSKDVAPLVEAREALVGMVKAADDFAKRSGTLQDQLALQVENAKARETNAEEQYTRGSIQDIEQRSKIATDEARKEIDLRKQLSDQIADIGIKLTNNENKLRTDFSRQQTDDLTKENEQLQKVQTDGFIQVREDAIDHANRLRDIARQTQQGDQQALLDRNFLKINQDRIGNQTAIDKENEGYREKEDKLARHLSDEAARINTSMNNERAQQEVAEKRKFADMQEAARQEELLATLHEKRKEGELQQAEQRQLNDLTTSENFKIELLQHNLQNELVLYAQQEQAKMKLLEATRDAIMAEGNKANPGFSTVTSAINTAVNAPGNFLRSLKLFGEGGSFGADEPFVMSERGAPESLGIGGRGYSIPGAAMVYPLQGGSVTPGKGGKGVTIQNLSIAVHEAKTPQMTADAVAHMIQDEFDQLMGVTN